MAKLEQYAERLQEEPEEVQALFRDLLIGVTDFFRDAAAFQTLETLVIPQLFEGRGADDEVRVWIAGCSTGEEAYSIAILLREHLRKTDSAAQGSDFCHRYRRDGDGGRPRGALSGQRRQGSLARAAEALFYPGNRDVLPGKGAARHVHLFYPQRHPRPAFLAPRPDLLPQFADLFAARTSDADHPSVSLLAATGRLSVSWELGKPFAVQRAVRYARQKEPHLPAPRSGRASAAAAAAIPAELAAPHSRK